MCEVDLQITTEQFLLDAAKCSKTTKFTVAVATEAVDERVKAAKIHSWSWNLFQPSSQHEISFNNLDSVLVKPVSGSGVGFWAHPSSLVTFGNDFYWKLQVFINHPQETAC